MKKTIKLIVTLILIMPFLYTAAWLYMASEINKSIDQFYDIDAPQAGYNLYGDKPKTSGFPFKPIITYKKGFTDGIVNITFDKLTITSLPISNQTLDLEIDTLAVQDKNTGQFYEIDNISTTVIIPKSLPATWTKANVTSWQKDVGQIKIKSLELNKNSMITQANGTIGLDSQLQPITDLHAKMADYDKLLHFLAVETSEITSLQAAIARSVLDSMAETDEATGQKFVEFDIKIKDRKLSLGPIQSMRLPKINWPEN